MSLSCVMQTDIGSVHVYARDLDAVIDSQDDWKVLHSLLAELIVEEQTTNLPTILDSE